MFNRVSREIVESVMKERDEGIKRQSGRLNETYGVMRMYTPEIRHEMIAVNLA